MISLVRRYNGGNHKVKLRGIRALCQQISYPMALLFSGPALANVTPVNHPPATLSDVRLANAVFVERVKAGNIRLLEPVDRLSRGDRVVTVVSWQSSGTHGGFTVTNPLPRAIAFQSSARADEEVSVDGGRTWGRLGTLGINGRIATPEDVTHVRWRVAPGTAARGRGQIAYSGIVR